MGRHLARTVSRVLADYSLRRFIAYGVNPMRWPQLTAMRSRRKAEIVSFARSLERWQGMAEVACKPGHFVFRRWLTKRLDAAQQGGFCPPTEDRDDPELRMRIDRLGWALELAAVNPAEAWAAVAGWFDTRPKAADFHRDSYSISERLSNLILLWNLCEPSGSLSAPLAAMMLGEADWLLRHPEYHGESGTNNHILNNARALILAGSFFDSPRLFDAGRWILDNQFGRHVLADGVVREASSHYQWVITRWIVDVACAFRHRDEDAFQRLAPSLSRMLDVCDAMAVSAGGRWYLPLIGDISPDFSPGFYRGLSAFGRRVVRDDEPSEDGTACEGFWGRHFGTAALGRGGDWIAADGSWARMARGSWSLFAHTDTSPGENRPTHGHHDLFSFDLAFESCPVIVDPGRGNYLSGRDEESAGILEEWHNTVLIGTARTGFIPRGYMPPAWLASFRPRPRVSLGAEGLSVTVDPMPEAGRASVQRFFSTGSHDGLRIVTRVSLADGAALLVRQVLYLAGEVRVEEGCAHLGVGGREIILRWPGLGRPAWRPALRYVAYETAVPCTRLEWNVRAKGPQWESVFDVAPTDGAP